MNAISIVLVIIVAFLAGMEGILDEFQFHQPLVACTLIGIVCGQPAAGIILGGWAGQTSAQQLLPMQLLHLLLPLSF